MKKISVIIITPLIITVINPTTALNQWDITKDQYGQEHSEIITVFDAYVYVTESLGESGIYGFNFSDPNSWTLVYQTTIPFVGACFVAPYHIYLCEYGGGIYTFNVSSLDLIFIANSAVSLNGLAFDENETILYGVSNTEFYEIDLQSGEHTFIGTLGTYLMIAIAIGNSICYSLDLITDSIYTIDLNNADVTLVGPTGYNFNYAQDMAYDKENDILYLAGYTTQGGLYNVDTTTGQCTLLGYFPGNIMVTAFAITYSTIDQTPPFTQLFLDPATPNGNNGWYVSNVTVTLNASDDHGIAETYYRLNKGDWNQYTTSFLVSEDGSYEIEYFSIDINGNIEKIKSENLSIDQTEPVVDISYEFINRRTIELTAEGMENGSGMSHVEFLLNNTVQKIDDTPPYDWIPKWPYPPPQIFLKVIAYDYAGNSAQDELGYSMPAKMYIFGFIKHPTITEGFFKFHAAFLLTLNYHGIIINKDLIIELSEYEGTITDYFINAKIWGFWIPVPKK